MELKSQDETQTDPSHFLNALSWTFSIVHDAHYSKKKVHLHMV